MTHVPVLDRRSLTCKRCGKACEPRANGWQHTRPRCGAPMRYGETCYRTVGHGPGHRTRYALDCQAASRRTGVAA